eukprot:4322704-Pleurochrysis_carterae.AAC.2
MHANEWSVVVRLIRGVAALTNTVLGAHTAAHRGCAPDGSQRQQPWCSSARDGHAVCCPYEEIRICAQIAADALDFRHCKHWHPSHTTEASMVLCTQPIKEMMITLGASSAVCARDSGPNCSGTI